MDALLSPRPLPLISKFFSEVEIADIVARIQRLRGNILAANPTLHEVSSSALPAQPPCDWKQTLFLMAWTLLFLIGTAFVFWRTGSRQHRYPPGPRAYPLVGNLFDFPAISDMVLRAQKWKEVRLLRVFNELSCAHYGDWDRISVKGPFRFCFLFHPLTH